MGIRERAQALADQQWTERVTITRNPELRRDAVIDPDTLEATEPPPDKVAEDLPMQIRPQGSADAAVVVVGQREEGQSDWRGAAPIELVDVNRDDVIHVDSSTHDPWLVGKDFVVREIAGAGLASRRVTLERYDR